MECPKCMRSEFVQPNGESHYICVTDDTDTAGCGTQFHVNEDKAIRFPQSVIFPRRNKNQFFRKPYLDLNPIEEVKITG